MSHERVTICWSDPPAPEQPKELDRTNSVLIHDMDLCIVDSGGQTNYPWVLNPNYPTNAATRTNNVRDNVEQVVITNTVTGAYTVVINHKGTLVSNDYQRVSIVLSGHIPENMDQDLHLTTSTNGWPKLEWNSAVGDKKAIWRTDNLIVSPWSVIPGSSHSIIQVQNEWVDPSGFSGDVRFYKIHEIE